MLAPSYLEYIYIQYILITCIYNLTITHAIYNLFICFYIIYYQPLSLHNCSWVPPLSFSSYIINVETISFEIKKGFDFCLVASVTGHVGYATHVQFWTRVMYPTCPVATGHWHLLENISNPPQTLAIYSLVFLMNKIIIIIISITHTQLHRTHT